MLIFGNKPPRERCETEIVAERRRQAELAKDKADDEAFRLECLEVSRVRERTYLGRRAKLRDEVLGAYGRMCACCGEVREAFLAIDHKNDDGAQHRRTLRQDFYAWLKTNKFPDTFQILCHSCNWAKSRGGCPHQLEKNTTVEMLLVLFDARLVKVVPPDPYAVAVAQTKARPVHCKYADQEMGTLAEVAEEVHIFARTRTRPSYREGNEGEHLVIWRDRTVEGGPYFRYELPVWYNTPGERDVREWGDLHWVIRELPSTDENILCHGRGSYALWHPDTPTYFLYAHITDPFGVRPFSSWESIAELRRDGK